MLKPLLRPSLNLDWTQPSKTLLKDMSIGLHNLQGSSAGAPLGFSIAHRIDPIHRLGNASECLCAFVSNGDNRTCDGKITRLSDAAWAVVDNLAARWLASRTLAHEFKAALGVVEGEFETIHFRNFLIGIVFTNDPDNLVADIRLYVDPPETALEAEHRSAEIRAVFDFLGEWNTVLDRHRYELPRPQDLLNAVSVT